MTTRCRGGGLAMSGRGRIRCDALRAGRGLRLFGKAVACMRRFEIRRGGPLCRRSALRMPRAASVHHRAASGRLRASEAVYRRARALVLTRDRGSCLLCGAPAVHVHHRLPRSASSTRNPARHRLSALVALCEAHHQLVESKRAWAFDVGLLVRRGMDPAEIPVWCRQGWVFLGDDGSIR